MSKNAGDEAIGATINKQGLLRIQATRVGKETALAQIIKLVEQAQGSKAPHPAGGGPGFSLLCTRSDPACAGHLHHLVGDGSGVCTCVNTIGGRTGHRLPLRHGTGHTHLHHGRCGQRR